VKLHGKNAAIHFNGVKVTVKSAWAITVQHEYADITTFRDLNKHYAVGLADIAGTFDGFLDVGADAAWSSTDGSVVAVAIYPTEGGACIAKGDAYIDAQVTAAVTDAIKCSGSWKAAGDWVIGNSV